MAQFLLVYPLFKKESARECLSSCFAMLKDIRSGNLIEGQLAIQIASTHFTAMTFLDRARDVDCSLEVREFNLNSATKLLRLYSNLVDCLDRQRGGMSQQMVVEGNVNIGSGSQAIVGLVSHTGPEKVSQNDDAK